MQTSVRSRWRSLPWAYGGLVSTTLGTVLLLMAQRPEFQRDPSSVGTQAVTISGHGMTWSGSAVLAARAILAARDRRASSLANPQVEVQKVGASMASAEESPPSSS